MKTFRIQTFREWMTQRDLFSEADEKKRLRGIIVNVMKLNDVINSKTGEDIPLEQLDLKSLKTNLESWSLWDKVYEQLPDDVQKDVMGMLTTPDNRRLADLLDALTSADINIGTSVSQDDSPPKPQE